MACLCLLWRRNLLHENKLSNNVILRGGKLRQRIYWIKWEL